MKMALLQGLQGKEREEFKEYLLNNKKLLDKLIKMLYNMYRDVENVSSNDYDSASWAFKQAHLNGKKEVIRNLISLLTLDPEENREPIL